MNLDIFFYYFYSPIKYLFYLNEHFLSKICRCFKSAFSKVCPKTLILFSATNKKDDDDDKEDEEEEEEEKSKTQKARIRSLGVR